ncbi:glycine betaine ABC transporter substrate-binding protein [Mesorhizobium sp. M0088]|uniref:glycine betaine ABC transporter substrate-binding protein n=1 Tax=Mesorhizobium sp. M0088 TaxID=2956873 RepID=UPI003338D1A9
MVPRFPKAQAFLTRFHIPNEEEAKIMGWIDGGTKPEDAAAKWIGEGKGKGSSSRGSPDPVARILPRSAGVRADPCITTCIMRGSLA